MARLSFYSYWRQSRAPRYSLTFSFPLLIAYELLAFALSNDAITGVRNGADVLLKSVFVVFGGRRGLIAFGLLLVGAALVLVVRDIRRSGGLEAWVFAGMAAESVALALIFGGVAGTLTALLLGAVPLALAPSFDQLGVPTQLMVSLGAGLYEELLFRVLLVGGMAWIAVKGLGWSRGGAGVFAAVAGALIFSAFHYVGPLGDPLELGSFTFRAIAGLLFSGLYLLRGFGITAWTHALYDVFLVAMR